MKRTGIIAVAFTVFCALAAAEGVRQAQWKKVEEAMNKGLPQSAIKELEPIIDGAMKDKAYAEAIKAIGKKIVLEGNIQGNKPEEKITRMKAAIAKAPPEMQPVMEAIMANWYWQYFQQNRWRFMQRTQTAAAPGEDFTTWDLRRILAEIDKQFTKALAAADVLKKTPVAEYNDLLEKGNAPDEYRPTLYDFLAHNALEFYSAGEQAGAKAEDAFDLKADSPIFAAADEFVAWKIETTDTDSPTLKAIRLYQDVLKFHASDASPAAFVDADLWRLNFGKNKAFGEEKNARCKAALQRLAEKHAEHELSARAQHDWATILQEENDLVAARDVARQAVAKFPESVGGRRCFNLIQQIEAKSLNVSSERVWNAPLPTIDVRYRNFTKVHFRIVPFDFDGWVNSNRYRPNDLSDAERQALARKQPVLQWSADLPATEDFQERLERLPAPQNAALKPGAYYLLASFDATFSPANNQVIFNDFWISDLSIVVRIRHGSGGIEGFVLNANSGEPLAGAEIKSWFRNNQGHRVVGPTAKTDENGLFRVQGTERGYMLLASHGGQRLATTNEYWVSPHVNRAQPYQRTIFFTDRALYRPGQTIQYKGISIEVNAEGDQYQTLAGRGLTVIFSDVNGKEIAKQQHKTNDYGSFSGSFTAPRDRLMGRMTIRVEGQPNGATQVSVEEYKRPKFQVAVDAPKAAAKLNGQVELKGKATAYTGAAIDGAKVKWRVMRQVRYPAWWYWRCWWMPPMPEQGQEIAHGTAATGTDGAFDVSFTARPDLSVSEKDEPTFQFTIHADVTDTTGETRSADRVVNVGYTALSATLSAADWQVDDKPVEIAVRSTTLDGEAQAAEGVLKVYRLKEPPQVVRGSLGGQHYYPMPVMRGRGGRTAVSSKMPKAPKEPETDWSNPNSWPLGEVVLEQGVSTDVTGNGKATAKLAVGMYRAKLETQDRFGKKVTAELPIRVLKPDANKLGIKVPDVLAAASWIVEPGSDLSALWGTGYEAARAFVEVEHRQKLLQSFWTKPNQTQINLKQKVTEAMRGGFTVRVTMVRENRAYAHSQFVDVPWTNKQLTVKWEHFTSKLQPAQKETWTAVITGPDAKKAVAEMVAGLYDASLDAYQHHGWQTAFGVFRRDQMFVQIQFENQLEQLQHLLGNFDVQGKDGSLSYRRFPNDIIMNFYGYAFRGEGGFGGGTGRARGLAMPMAAAPPAPGAMMMEKAAGAPMMAMDGLAANNRAMDAAPAERQGLRQDAAKKRDGGGGGPEGEAGAGPDLSKVSARANLQETAFFFPHLLSDKDGEVKLQFTMPEALTEWKFMGFAHDRDSRSGYLQDKVVTAKDLMVQPNPPRFLREGNLLEFTVKVSNQSAGRQTGKIRLTLADARTAKSVDAVLGNTAADQEFDVPAAESRTFSWRLKVADDLGFLTYKTVASTGRLSDGEEGFLPVLASRILVTESLPLPIRGKQTKEFDFARLRQSGQSDTLRHKSLTVQMVSNPSWYAVMALPYLMEFPHECTEQTFNRLYANALARHIANSDPKIHRIFEQWRGTPALDSPMEKNQDLKAVMIEETPWLRQAQAESQARRNVGILFDDNRLNDETARLMQKLSEQQRADGAWPWFPGGPPNDYITLYITTGFGRMRHLGVDLKVDPAIKSLNRLDGWVDEMYREILKHSDKDKNHLSTTIALYLYGRSFFLKDKAVGPQHKEAVDYWLGQAKKYWLDLAHRQSQAHLAIALKRFGDLPTAQGIMRSIKERSVSDEELGMFWRELELSWWWYRAPIETQAMMIEAFDEVMNDATAVEDCKVWLLKQKQTQDWKTTKATADAVYALLLRGSQLLASDALVEVSLAGQPIKPENVEAGTGCFEKRFAGGEVKPEFGRVTLKKVDDGVAWGSLHWQYLEDMSKVTPYEGTPLKMAKKLYTKQNTKKGPELQPVAGPVSVGDELVVRVGIIVDRDMEYVHLKDYRASGVEPVNVLSQYKYQDGLAYYESTRDTASHFFIDYLPKGKYIFEYSVRVQHKGRYQTGMAQIQCMYAPDFNSHSESVWLEVK